MRAEDVLRAPYLMEEFDADLIKSYLAYLTPENMITTISGPTIEGDERDPWFDVPYRLEQRPISKAEPSSEGLHLPTANPFLPEDLALVTVDAAGPMRAVTKPGLELWLDSETGNVLKRQDFALSGKLMRTTYYPKYKTMYSDSKGDDVYIAEEVRIFDEIEKGRNTTVIVQDVALDSLEDNIFTKAWLESKSR